MGLVRVKLGLSDSLTLGNLNSYRDWGHAKDYVQAMHLMMQSPSPSDFVIATGVTRSIKDFIHEVAKRLEIGLEWIGSGLNERAVDPSSGKIIINVDAKFFRTSELNYLCGNPSKARTILGWIPSFSFGDLVEDMIQSDLKLLSVVKKNKLV
jgi:GDPmannose 4,6-dehydratase